MLACLHQRRQDSLREYVERLVFMKKVGFPDRKMIS
jgi:hypothetical protein